MNEVEQSPVRSTAELREAVLFDGPAATQKVSRFWLLLALAAVIASAGVITESDATVIGAMIVAPLRTPILGLMLAVVLGDHTNLVRSLGHLIAGALATIGIGYVMGLIVILDVDSLNNTQVAGYSTAGVIDLIAALAVGAVGSIALARRDVADAVPGVAIALALVPPLTVVGLTLESGSSGDAAGAILLFLTNVAAILAVGIVIMRVYHVRAHNQPLLNQPRVNQRGAYSIIGALLVLIVVLLARASWTTTRDAINESDVRSVVSAWADSVGWELIDVETREDDVIVELHGPPPTPDLGDLAAQLREVGIDPTQVQLDLLPRQRISVETTTPDE